MYLSLSLCYKADRQGVRVYREYEFKIEQIDGIQQVKWLGDAEDQNGTCRWPAWGQLRTVFKLAMKHFWNLGKIPGPPQEAYAHYNGIDLNQRDVSFDFNYNPGSLELVDIRENECEAEEKMPFV